MKKMIVSLLIVMMGIGGGAYAAGPTPTPKSSAAAVAMKCSLFKKNTVLFGTEMIDISKAELFSAEDDPVEQPTVEPNLYSDDIPLTPEEQAWLREACEEFGVPYALTLGLIEKESTFQNFFGDNGNSAGYMQIQKRWHWGRMERLGVTDLMEPRGNFRVGCDFLAELYAKYNDWSLALTAYNFGHYPGYVTNYAKDVMANYACWQEVINKHVSEMEESL